ncbi:MAG TPA: alpha/beta fold hydrolase [Bryobacteraceae bacterium]|nr:alpha/beta fold hydrolase [Bryobacteraceae bacterium]
MMALVSRNPRSVYWVAAFVAALAAFQTSCMPASWGAAALLHPSRRALKVSLPPGAENVSIDGDGVQLSGWFFGGSPPRRGTVIYLHGSADNRASGLSIAQRYLARGFDTLIYDSRAHGESGGDACTYGFYEKRDLERAIDTVPNKPVVLIGVSLGGAVALQAAAEDRRIGAVIAVATFCDLRTVATERAPFFATKREIAAAFKLAEAQAHFTVDAVNPVAAAPRIQAPVFLIHGQDDKDTPPWHSERVFQALRAPKRLLLVPGAGHNDALRPEIVSEIDAWIDKAIPLVAAVR